MPAFTFSAKIDTSDFDAALARLVQQQLPYAGSVALNKTANAVLDAERGTMQGVFDNPTPFTLNSLRVKRATKSDLVAEVRFKDATSGNRSAEKYLTPEVLGGNRRVKGIELLLRSRGLLDAGSYLVPASTAKLDANGNLMRSQYNQISAADVGGQNVAAFLDTIIRSEIGDALIRVSDGGYNVLVGSTPAAPRLFTGYADHPLPNPPGIQYQPGKWSTAAGGHQIVSKWWPHYRRSLGLPDFSPVSQDRYAIQQIRESHALPLVQAGRFGEAVAACNHIWASLTGSPYGQHTNPLELLRTYYVAAGGVVRA